MPSNTVSWRLWASFALVGVAMVFTIWCLIVTTALSMTAFFSLGLPLYVLGALLFIWEIFRDLRQHEVL